MLENTQESRTKLKNAIQEDFKIVHVSDLSKLGQGGGGVSGSQARYFLRWLLEVRQRMQTSNDLKYT